MVLVKVVDQRRSGHCVSLAGRRGGLCRIHGVENAGVVAGWVWKWAVVTYVERKVPGIEITGR